MDITQGNNDETCLEEGANWPFEEENWEGAQALKDAKFSALDGYALYHYRSTEAEKASLFGDDINVSVIDHSVSIYGDEFTDGFAEACCTIEAIEDVEGGNSAG